ncbi:MAG: toprim domain-containing protein [Rhodospirillales bacterium]|nr:toprim domain-containing protein [Rhodospirillales bacterium]
MRKAEITMKAAELARLLARQAEAVCRHYLPAGRRQGRYWLVGDVHNRPGRSLFVRLSGNDTGKGAAGHWQDSATGQFGDLLDLIRERCGLSTFRDVADEARRFLGLPSEEGTSKPDGGLSPSVHRSHQLSPDNISFTASSTACLPSERTEAADAEPDAQALLARNAAQRLFASARPIRGTLAERYLHARGIIPAALAETEALRFHPRCFYRASAEDRTASQSVSLPLPPLQAETLAQTQPQPEALPALIASVTDLNGTLTGIQRTWLDSAGFHPTRLGKAPLATPRRALGLLLGHAVRFGIAEDVMAAGEGIETMLSLRAALPRMPMAASLSATHLAVLLFPPKLRRLYIARDADPAGDSAVARLIERAAALGIEALVLSPSLGDFNDDLRAHGGAALRSNLWEQLRPDDCARFMPLR